MTATPRTGRPRNPDSRSRLAARYAHLHGVRLVDAANEFDLTQSAVHQAWLELYPNQSPRQRDRGAQIDEHW